MTKDELLDALEDERERFLDTIEELSEDDMLQPGVVGAWSVKDILYHLVLWEAELVKILWRAAQGQKPTIIYEGDATVDEINAAWYEQGNSRPLEKVMDDFITVRIQTSTRIEAFKDKELSDPQLFFWLKDRPLWDWIAEDSFRHEAEHGAQIRAWRELKGL